MAREALVDRDRAAPDGRVPVARRGRRFGLVEDALRELLETGKVTPVIDRRYELSEVADAFRYLGEGHTQGKVVVTV
jgi:NADPH:quinone reductase-like Zn-dependent oxidoreductase